MTEAVNGASAPRFNWRRLLPSRALRQGIIERINEPRERPLRIRSGLGRINGATFQFHGDFSQTPEAAYLKDAFDAAVTRESPLPAEIQAIEGMSGQKYRAFINHVMRIHQAPAYLEIGSWAGSTAASALSGNALKALCIDNWSLFGGPREAFFANIEKVLTDRIKFEFIESDFRAVDYSKIGPFNVYLFDGPHEEADQYDGVALALSALTERFIFIVDDWNWGQARIGTLRALHKCGCSLEAAIEVRTTQDGSHPKIAFEKSDWHNGYFFGVVSKPKRS